MYITLEASKGLCRFKKINLCYAGGRKIPNNHTMEDPMDRSILPLVFFGAAAMLTFVGLIVDNEPCTKKICKTVFGWIKDGPQRCTSCKQKSSYLLAKEKRCPVCQITYEIQAQNAP
jgi:uncharacterized paraquat-inducible protein A